MLKWQAMTVIILVTAVSIWLFHRADLVIRGETPVFETMPGGPGREHRIATLRAGERLTVYACIDDKSYYGYEIKLQDGRTGYVLPGNTEIVQKSFLLPPYSRPIVWNCL